MENPFFEHPILNSPYECPQRHWELDKDGQPTQRILILRRRAENIPGIKKCIVVVFHNSLDRQTREDWISNDKAASKREIPRVNTGSANQFNKVQESCVRNNTNRGARTQPGLARASIRQSHFLQMHRDNSPDFIKKTYSRRADVPTD